MYFVKVLKCRIWKVEGDLLLYVAPSVGGYCGYCLSSIWVICYKNTVIHPNNTCLPLYAFDIHIPSRFMLALQPGTINKIGLNGLLQLKLQYSIV